MVRSVLCLLCIEDVIVNCSSELQFVTLRVVSLVIASVIFPLTGYVVLIYRVSNIQSCADA